MNQKNEDQLRKLADYLILNGYSKNVSGLYFGKAGNALVLFEIAGVLDDEWINDHAFELLNQSLLSKTKVCDLLNGVAGIAYALQYTIEGEFIDAEITDLYGDQIEMLRKNFVQEHSDSIERIYKLSHWVYVLRRLHQPDSVDLRSVAIRYIQEEFDYIDQQMSSLLSGQVVNNYRVQQRYQLLCSLIDKWVSTEVLPTTIHEWRTKCEGTIDQLYELGYWMQERIKPIPTQIKAISDPSLWDSSMDVEAVLTQNGRAIKSSFFEGAGRVALLELCAMGKANERILELLSLPDLTAIQGDQKTIAEEEKI